jgi:hypothetical protein
MTPYKRAFGGTVDRFSNRGCLVLVENDDEACSQTLLLCTLAWLFCLIDSSASSMNGQDFA